MSHHCHHHSSLLLFLFFILLFVSYGTCTTDGCQTRLFPGGDSPVCVCTAAHCPSLLPPHPHTPSQGHALTYTTSREGHRFRREEVPVYGPESSSKSATEGGRDSRDVVMVDVGRLSLQQTMTGFGGALTDSAAITMNSLTPPALDALLRLYFSPDGIEYDLLRIPIGGSDFSLRPYTYDDDHHHDLLLQHFQLADEDLEHKLPLLRRALQMSRRPLRVLASPWGPPAWMKINNMIHGSGELLKEMWQPWADYLVKFIKVYEEAGVPIWAITSQNHPFAESVAWNSLFWTPAAMRDWIKGHLGPSLHTAGLERVKVYIGDDNRDAIDLHLRQILNDPEASRYVWGLAVHWYQDTKVGPQTLTHAHHLFPDKDILYTESCIESRGDPSHQPVILGSWKRAERYATNIIEDVNHYVSGWVDWNMALDLTGGPNWAKNNVDAPVIINTEEDEFYLQPMFFMMGHFSKFVPAGSVFIPSWVRGEGEGAADHLHTAAFLHPKGHVILQLFNKGDAEREVRVEWEGGTFLYSLLPPRSLQTLLLPWEGDVTHAKMKYTSQGQHCHH